MAEKKEVSEDDIIKSFKADFAKTLTEGGGVGQYDEGEGFPMSELAERTRKRDLEERAWQQAVDEAGEP